ncbi:Riboflavin transport system permease protein RibX [Rhodoplanes serenus]|uniref:Riboflavin transport system permease protein RibX n=1 Tax=Rhodoplanes serenus TaxID=200615 RepID=A0A3S4BZF9_9BRAD|nr:ABC transporter permease subunit [Rhodoplanes serenus]VCU11204.1 Riboflavin transport system permease protein RibX [Rhodoplanes serenus]
MAAGAMARAVSWLWGGLGLLALGLAWEAGHRAFGPFVLPAPAEAGARLAALLADGDAWPALAVTAGNALGGWLAGALVGAGLGIAGGLVGPLGAALRPVVTVTLGVPPIAWVVLALLWFGPRGGAPAFTVLVTAMPVVFAAAFQGLAARDPRLGEMATVYGAPLLLRLRMLILPQLLDHLLPALATALALAFKVAVMAEVLGGGVGIGGRIATARAHLDLVETMAWILLVVAVLLVCDGLILAPLRRLMAGRRSAAPVSAAG